MYCTSTASTHLTAGTSANLRGLRAHSWHSWHVPAHRGTKLDHTRLQHKQRHALGSTHLLQHAHMTPSHPTSPPTCYSDLFNFFSITASHSPTSPQITSRRETRDTHQTSVTLELELERDEKHARPNTICENVWTPRHEHPGAELWRVTCSAAPSHGMPGPETNVQPSGSGS